VDKGDHGGERMSEVTTENYERAVNEKIEKFIADVFHSPAAQFWIRLLSHELVQADVANSIDKVVKHILDSTNVADLLSGERTFDFTGEESECELARAGVPHTPHLIGSYMTVRYGAMDVYCLGREGSISLWGYRLNIIIDLKRDRGGAHGRVRVEVTA